MIVLDLEWNRGYDRRPLNEILQIGAVRIDRLGGPILDTFNAYIKPIVHKKFDLGARSLPELAQSKASGLSFAAAAEAFRAWCGGETVFAGWGIGDLDILNESCKYWGMPPFSSETVLDFQRAFSYVLGTEQQIALWRAAVWCGIPDIFEYHNALHDAMYTAIVGAWLTPESLTHKPEPVQRGPKPRLRFCKIPFPTQPRSRLGPLPTAEDALNAQAARTCACPLCGQKGYVTRWHFAPSKGARPPQQYFGVFSCPEHGRFLCRLTLTQLENGTWQGRRTVPALTPELLADYTAAFQGGVHNCKGRRKRRSHR